MCTDLLRTGRLVMRNVLSVLSKFVSLSHSLFGPYCSRYWLSFLSRVVSLSHSVFGPYCSRYWSIIGRLLVDYNFRHRLLYLHRYNLVIIGVPIISLVIVSLYKEYLFRPNPSRPMRDT